MVERIISTLQNRCASMTRIDFLRSALHEQEANRLEARREAHRGELHRHGERHRRASLIDAGHIPSAEGALNVEMALEVRHVVHVERA